MKVKKYNDHLTKYESKDAIVTVDKASGQIHFDLSRGLKKKSGIRKKDFVLKRKCLLVNDNVNKRIKAICDSFIVEIDTNTKETTITIM